jgi:cytochrome c553
MLAGWPLVPPRSAVEAPRVPAPHASTEFEVPAWLYPQPPSSAPAVFDSVTPIRLRGSRSAFPESRLHSLFFAPDWDSRSHPIMPPVVAVGRRPEVYACGYCHMPDGAGRPENVMLAGLPAAYIVAQVLDMKQSARHGAYTGSFAPSDNMWIVARAATDAEVSVAAEYFSQLQPRQRTRVVQAVRIPKVQAAVGLYRVAAGTETEPLDGRVVEVPADFGRHEHRDPRVAYTSYVPVGSVARGRALAATVLPGSVLSCTGCHGPQLRGGGTIPPIAGRSPAYLVRQLVAFRTGARAGPSGATMQLTANAMSLPDMIAVSAYAASLRP